MCVRACERSQVCVRACVLCQCVCVCVCVCVQIEYDNRENFKSTDLSTHETISGLTCSVEKEYLLTQ